ncbi:MAG: RNA polymerase sigma-70 factor [Anditalea sp.]
MRLLIKYPEKELVLLLRQGEIKAFDELYYRYVPRLMAFARTFILDEQEAEEAVQEIFIKIWEKRKSMDELKNFKSYLFQSVKNHLFNHIRDKKKTCQLEDIPDERFPREDNVLENLSYKELENTAIGIIASLPKVQQEVFTLSKMEGLTNTEIAVKLSLSKRTVEHHIYLSVKYLRGKLMHKASIWGTLLIAFYC